jgi:hypothetical protein
VLGKIPNESNIDKWIALNNEWDALEQQIAREDEAFAEAEEADEREERKSSESSL